MDSMKVSMELRGGVFFGWKLSAGACSDQDVSCAHRWAHLGDFLRDKHLSLGLKYSSTWAPAEAELAGEVERDFVCVWAFVLLSLLWGFLPSPHRSGSELLEKGMLLLCQAGLEFQALKCFTSMRRRKRGGRGKKRKSWFYFLFAIFFSPA